MEYLPFRIAGRDFVIDASRVRAIAPFEGSPERHSVPIIDLRRRLGLPGVVYGRRQFLVVVETGASESGIAGFVADYVSDLIKGSPDQRRGGRLRGRGRPKWVLDPDTLSIKDPSSLSPQSPAQSLVSHPE
ncbi:MAG: chemotaxis protein CheW [Acidobacteriia bacterium]|jgi:chemotaxis signal transduction protein|nr:chemotaxis protein CheW [Terriglobia bacterium]